MFIHSYPQIRQISLALFAAVDPTSPHGYYCTRNTPIRSQTTIQPRAGSRGWNRTQDASKQPFPEGLLRLLCLVKRAAHYKTASEGRLGISPPGSFVSHQTAGRIWGGIVPDTPDVHVTVSGKAGRTSRQGVKAHAKLDGTAVTRFRNLPVTTPEQTFLDLATGLDLVALVVLGDSLIRAGRTSTAVLRDAATAWRGRGAKLARRAARYVRDGVDSAMETRLRMLLVLAGRKAARRR